MIGGVLVEKDVETVKKEMDIQIANVNKKLYKQIKQTLEMVHKTLNTQEGVMKEFERKYEAILKPQQGKPSQSQNNQENSRTGGVLV